MPCRRSICDTTVPVGASVTATPSWERHTHGNVNANFRHGGAVLVLDQGMSDLATVIPGHDADIRIHYAGSGRSSARGYLGASVVTVVPVGSSVTIIGAPVVAASVEAPVGDWVAPLVGVSAAASMETMVGAAVSADRNPSK
ncbi:expressed unknown protein [Seminavis robusta]|uniref:Uncharacterized protein n=1 Tax=Seminavis robusta TaxID=568900 RepID=A0A9N8HQG3_9STRA|nr:expressed unknown protein [Seminavis robusta]|eukprot:Sro1163_g247990.1 n/a (142) ;mRNA; r:22548-22973